MKFDLAIFRPWFGVTIFFLATADVGLAQTLPVGHARDFTTESFFEPPHEQQVKLRLSGSDASPLPGGLMDLKQMHVETFTADAKPEMVVRAPQCTYELSDGGVASSAGPVEIQSADGKFYVAGDGFLWRQNDNVLTISNSVRTVIKSGFFSLPTP
jgi:hypothetical protein